LVVFFLEAARLVPVFFAPAFLVVVFFFVVFLATFFLAVLVAVAFLAVFFLAGDLAFLVAFLAAVFFLAGDLALVVFFGLAAVAFLAVVVRFFAGVPDFLMASRFAASAKRNDCLF